jgi:hypothetical protein
VHLTKVAAANCAKLAPEIQALAHEKLIDRLAARPEGEIVGVLQI